MNKIASHSKRIAVSILSFLFIMEEVSLFAAAFYGYFAKLPPNELGANLLLAVFFIALALINVLAFSVTYFFLRKLIKLEICSALLGVLIAANIAPLVVLFGPRSQEKADYYFFGTYAVVVGFLTLMKIYAMLKGSDAKPSQ